MLDTLTPRLLLGLFLSGSSGSIGLSGWPIPVLQVPLAGSSRPAFSTGLPPSLPGSFGVCFAAHGELGPAQRARLISLILLWVWLLSPAAPYINRSRRAAIPRHRLFLITVAEFSVSKRLWTVSASSPFAHVLEGPPCPPAAQLCWEEAAFFPFGNEAGKVRAAPFAWAGSCACVFWGIFGGFGGVLPRAPPEQSGCRAQRAVSTTSRCSAGGDLASKWEFFSAGCVRAFSGTGSRWLAAIPSASQRENLPKGPRAPLLPSTGCGVTRALHGLVGQGSRVSQEGICSLFLGLLGCLLWGQGRLFPWGWWGRSGAWGAWFQQIPSSDKEHLSPPEKQDSPCCLS